MVAVLFMLLSTTGTSLAEESSQSAYQSVVESTDLLLGRLIEVQPIYESDPDLFFSEVDDALDPYIDFEGFAKGVMAKHYRKANEDQRTAFKASFREALVKTYATALLEFDNQRVEVKEPVAPGKRPGRAAILLEVHAKSGTIFPVQYQLGLKEGRWLLRNVIINGINIGLQFRSQFNAYMQKHRGDIDKVIENWTVDVDGDSKAT
jgi:phospholipid transport system substrate-binding protein